MKKKLFTRVLAMAFSAVFAFSPVGGGILFRPNIFGSLSIRVSIPDYQVVTMVIQKSAENRKKKV